MMEFNLKKESLALYDNMKETTEEAIRGPIGLFSNPIRFMFYAAVGLNLSDEVNECGEDNV